MSVRISVDYKELSQLEAKIAKLPGRTEEELNDVLHSDGIKIATEEITSLMPMSTPRTGLSQRRHAKTSKWSRSERENLGFLLKSKGGAANRPSSFGYLVFPDEGRGRSNPIAQMFLKRGLEAAVPRIMERMLIRVDKLLEEEL